MAQKYEDLKSKYNDLVNKYNLVANENKALKKELEELKERSSTKQQKEKTKDHLAELVKDFEATQGSKERSSFLDKNKEVQEEEEIKGKIRRDR